MSAYWLHPSSKRAALDESPSNGRQAAACGNPVYVQSLGR
jgi:hypothetical protein